MTRLAQGPLDEATGELADPLDPDRDAVPPPGDDAGTAHGAAQERPAGTESADVVTARS